MADMKIGRRIINGGGDIIGWFFQWFPILSLIKFFSGKGGVFVQINRLYHSMKKNTTTIKDIFRASGAADGTMV